MNEGVSENELRKRAQQSRESRAANKRAKSEGGLPNAPKGGPNTPIDISKQGSPREELRFPPFRNAAIESFSTLLKDAGKQFLCPRAVVYVISPRGPKFRPPRGCNACSAKGECPNSHPKAKNAADLRKELGDSLYTSIEELFSYFTTPSKHDGTPVRKNSWVNMVQHCENNETN